MTTDSDLAIDSEALTEATDSEGLAESTNDRPWLFRAGDSRAVEAGRRGGSVTKKQSLPERLRVETDRRADKIIDGILTQAEKGNTRAFIAVMDRTYGVPATKLVIEQADNPAADLLMRMMAHRANAGPTGLIQGPSNISGASPESIDGTNT